MMSLILTVFPVLFLLLFYTMPETPAYLVRIKRVAAAEAVLRLFRGADYADLAAELKQIEADVEKVAASRAGVSDLVASPANRRALLCSLMLMVFQQMSGVNAVVFYTVQIFKVRFWLENKPSLS